MGSGWIVSMLWQNDCFQRITNGSDEVILFESSSAASAEGDAKPRHGVEHLLSSQRPPISLPCLLIDLVSSVFLPYSLDNHSSISYVNPLLTIILDITFDLEFSQCFTLQSWSSITNSPSIFSSDHVLISQDLSISKLLNLLCSQFYSHQLYSLDANIVWLFLSKYEFHRVSFPKLL